MKIPSLAIWFIQKRFERMIAKAVTNFYPDPIYRPKNNIPYLDDNHENHKFDVYYAKAKRKNVTIIDIHGGSYLFGHRLENYNLARIFLDEGYDFIAVDYVPNTGKRNTIDIVRDCVDCLHYISLHLRELNMEDNRFVICGDSAGGHLALLMAEILANDALKEKFTSKNINIKLEAILLNCPVYDYVPLGEDSMTRRARRRMFGPTFENMEERALISPREHIDDVNIPIFLSTSRYDFIRNESITLNKDLEARNIDHNFVDIYSDNKKVAHVHNIIHPKLDESVIVNQAMLTFLSEKL